MLILRALSIVALALLLAAADSWRRPVVLPLKAPPRPVAGPGAPGTPVPAGGEAPTVPPAGDELGLDITVAQALDLYAQGFPFIDARKKSEFEAARVRGAIHCTPDMFLKGDNSAVLDLPREVPIVLYCGGGDCHDSHNLGALLGQAGFARIHVMKDGFPGWHSAGHEVDSGPAGGVP